MKKEYIKLEVKEDKNFIRVVASEIVGTKENIKYMTVCLLLDIVKRDKECLFKIFEEFMECLENDKK